MEEEVKNKKRQWSEPKIIEMEIKMTECFGDWFGGHGGSKHTWSDNNNCGCS